ncbi:MAG TPA: carboxyl transferase domain-containing protein [Solirubrobacteraceae bacterium]|nr:carboxyl transferase domain-containing protein [Solirubrobacteraceae bacterium]
MKAGEFPPTESGGLNEKTLSDSAVVELVPETASAAFVRLQALLDDNTFQSWRSAVGDGVIAGSARVHGRPVCVWAQDGSHRGGSLGRAGGETIARTIRHANRTGVPVLGLPHSGGARLQEGVGALSAYGAIFREQALARVPQITLIGGACAGGAAYSPALGDFVVMVGPDARLFLTGPKVVEQVTREQISAEDLGGPRIHAANGVAHLIADDDRSAVKLLRELLGYLPSTLGGVLPFVEAIDPPAGCPADHLPASTRLVYDVRDVIAALVDGGRYLELAARWARNMVTMLARLDGRPVGVIANQARHLGGTIDSAASEKGSWFVDLCDRLALPLVVLVDTPGFLPGTNQERAGVIRYGSALLRAFARATTPRLTVTLRQAYGGAHIVMNSRDLGADLTLAWPRARIGIMGAAQAVAISERRAIAAGSDVEQLKERYTSMHLAVDVAAADGFVDEIVLPSETRERLIRALELHA